MGRERWHIFKMAVSKMPLLSAMHMRNSFKNLSMRLKGDNTASTPTPSKQSGETRPRQPRQPIMRFTNERRSKIMSELQKEASKRWTELSEEAKRLYVENYETAKERWLAEKALMKAQFEAMEEEGKRGEGEETTYTGRHLFFSEVQIPGATTTSDFVTKDSQMWNDLTPEEKEAYLERARKINEEGHKDLLAATMKKIKTKNYGQPVNAATQFRNKFVSVGLKEAYKEIKREWSELSDEERGKYVKPYEEERKLYNAQMEEYRAGDKYAENKRKSKVIKAKIKEIEEEMNKPKCLAAGVFDLFMMDKRESIKGKGAPERSEIASAMFEALTEEEQMEYKEKWRKLKADWQTDVAEWDERNAYSPKMTELRGYKEMLETAKKQRSF